MKHNYNATILADSISPMGYRLTTFEVTFPRLILAEFNTPRKFSRNSASSRAIPPEKNIENVLTHPFIPHFGTRVKGMGSGEANTNQRECVEAWLQMRDYAVEGARKLIALGADKARINRPLEAFMWQTAIVSATDWSNFFALRAHKDAQLEFQIIAKMMEVEWWCNIPQNLEIGEAHLPLVSSTEKQGIVRPEMISAGRCAKVSFDTHGVYEDPLKSYNRAASLIESGHWSPAEHQAQVGNKIDDSLNGNFSGDWIQFRKTFENEHDWSLRKQ